MGIRLSTLFAPFLVLHGLETAVDFQALMPLVSALFVALYFVLCHDVSPLG